ncbi:MAG: single-stranded DNA-binding protein [Chloroflexi bacterium]|nr:single-stranded DNA-binding protein [Chloroflexota bacterium]
MAKDLNKVMITGRLGKDVDLRVTPNGNSVATFSVASGRNVKDGDGWKEQTEWFRVVAWEKLAENCSNLLKKGSHVFIEGRLQTREWQDKEGQKRYSTEVIATDMYMLDSKRSQEDGSGGSGGEYQSNTAPSRNKPAPRRNDNPFDDEAEPEDIPF